MLRDLESTSKHGYQDVHADRPAVVPEWRAVHEYLRRTAKQRAELDASEARWLRRAEELRIWRRFGCATVFEYLERELGYGPRAARDRLRVARALGDLPEIERALAEGTLKYTAVRELTRVAVRANEGRWLDKVRGKNLRQIEELVTGRRRGSNPEDPTDPERRLRQIPFEDISPETYALARQARTALADEHGEHLDDDRFLATWCRRVLEPQSDSAAMRPTHQIAVTLCEHCKRAWQLGGGRMIELAPAAIEHATCDANHIGSLEAEQPERAKAEIPPATRRLGMHRDHARCTVPSCRSARGLDVHHVIHREHGGDHDPRNLTVTCFFHHQQTHAGLLEISGRAPDQLRFVRRDAGVVDAGPLRGDRACDAELRQLEEPAPKDADPRARFERIEIETQTRDALVGMGFKPAEARAAITEARTHVGRGEITLEMFLRAALTKAPKSKQG